jgi:hypothetical protein
MPAHIVVDAVRFALASHSSLVEVDFIEELEAYKDRGQCTSVFIGIRNISSYFDRVLHADPKCASFSPTHYALHHSNTVPFDHRYHEALVLAADPKNCIEQWHWGNHLRSRGQSEAPVHYFFSVVTCMKAGHYTQPGLPHTLLEYVYETLKYVGKSPPPPLVTDFLTHPPHISLSHKPFYSLSPASCFDCTLHSNAFTVLYLFCFFQPPKRSHLSSGKRPLNMLIWMLHFTQQLGGISRFTPGSPFNNFIFNLADTIQRMTTADTLSGSRSISCLSMDLVTLRSITSFVSPNNFDIALKNAEAIFSSANDLGDDYAITEALKLYRRAVRLRPSSGHAWWGIGSCFEFWGARRWRPSPHVST